MRVAVAILALALFPGRAAATFFSSPAQSAQSHTAADAESELQTGIALTRHGRFQEAIPHFLAARGHVADEYAANFNLALCYVGTGQPELAVPILKALRDGGHATAAVYNLLAQAYVGSAQPKLALHALHQAAALTPNDEKLYLLVADACMDHQAYSLGLQVVNLGLKNVPQSARLHYQRAFFLSLLERSDLAQKDYAAARTLAPGTDIAFLATAQESLFAGNMPAAIQVARQAIQQGHQNYILLAILGQALLRAGAAPGQSGFAEALSSLEKSVAERPNFADSQIALGKVYLMQGRLDDAMAHLQAARQLSPANLSVYASLADAYRRKGDMAAAQKMLAILSQLNARQAAAIRSAPGDRKASYATGLGAAQPKDSHH